jgi:general secretion pathway protein A
MRQVAQRITGRYHLEPLSAADAAIYIRHRMKVAGAHTDIFTPAAIRKLYGLSRGIPRLINVIADRALLAGYAREQRSIGSSIVKDSAREVFGGAGQSRWRPWLGAVAASLALALFGTAVQDALSPARTAGEQTLDSAALETTAGVTAETAEAVGGPVQRTTPMPNAGSAQSQFQTAASSEALLGDLLLQTDESGELSATSSLFRLWKAELRVAESDTCGQAEAQGLLCYWSTGIALGELRQLNLPVILMLTGEDGSGYRAVLSGLAYDSAELVIAGQIFRVNLAELSHYWYGDTLMLWRPPAGDISSLSPGLRNERVRWLRDSLAAIRGETASTADATYYDDALLGWVRDYQANRRLGVDGIVGVRTQIAIQSDLKLPGVPLLMAEH